jgi:hypothetical protein
MSQTYEWACIDPISAIPTYTASSGRVDFEISAVNEDIETGSITLTCDWASFADEPAGTLITAQDDINIDNKAGAASLIRALTISSTNMGVIESIGNYPRWARMVTEATMTENQLGVEVSSAMQMQAPNYDVARGYLRGKSAAEPYQSVAHPLICGLNTATVSGTKGLRAADLPGNKFGIIKIEIELPPVNEVYFGAAAGTISTAGAAKQPAGYRLTNMKLRYKRRVTDLSKAETRAPINVHTVKSIKRSIESNNASLANMVALKCDGVAITFCPRSESGTYTYNTNATRVLPALNKVVFAINDVDNKQISFPLEHREAVLANYLSAFRLSPSRNCLLADGIEKSGVYIGTYAPGECFGIGLGWNSLIDFSQAKFDLQIITGSVVSGDNTYAVNSITPYDVYLFFTGYIQV